MGRGGETANSSEISGGQSLTGGQRGIKNRWGSLIRESGRSGRKGFQHGKGDLGGISP